MLRKCYAAQRGAGVDLPTAGKLLPLIGTRLDCHKAARRREFGTLYVESYFGVVVQECAFEGHVANSRQIHLPELLA